MLHSFFKSTKTSTKTGNSNKDKDTSSSRSSRRAGQSGRRLVRSQNIRGLRYSDDDLSNDASRSSLFSTEHSSVTVSASTRGSRSPTPSIQCPSNAVTYLPLPPLSLNSSILQHTVQGSLSVSSPRSWDGDMTLGYSTDSASSDESSATHGIFSAVSGHSEGYLQSLPGTHIGSSPGVAALGQGYGGGLHIHTRVQRAQKSAPNSTLTSPVSSPKAWGWSSASNNLQQGSSLTSMGSSYDKSTGTYAHPLPLPPTLSTATASAPTSLLSPRSSIVTPHGLRKPESGPPVCKWQKGRLLGSGAFGRVYKGIHGETGEFCAIKEVEFIEDDPKSKESAKQLEQEIMLLSSLRHPNIVPYKGSEMVGGYLNIYLEFVSGGSIYKLCQEFVKLEEPIVRRYTRQILQGLHFLHSLNIVHRDIKGANILVDQEGTIKLADFGMAKHIKQQGADLLSFKGSPYWMAPEVIMQKNTGFEYAIDIWSLGCTVLEMVTGKPPWSEYEGVAAVFKVTRAEIPPLPQSLSLEGQSFIKLCLERNPADRPTAAELLQHAFVRIPNDGPMQAMHIRDFWSSDVEERSTTRQNSGSSIDLLRGGSQPLNRRQNSRARLRVDIYPSRSAPVSPRSSHKDMNESGSFPLPGFSTPPAGSPRRTGFSTPPPPGSPRGTGFSTPPAGSPRRMGFSTPPPGSPRGTGFSTPPGSPRGRGFSRSPAGSPRGTGFDFDVNHGSSNTAGNGKTARRQAHANNGLPSSSVHDMVNRSDSHWDVVYENRQVPHKDNGFYRTEDVRSYREEEQDYARKTYRTLQQMDEKLTQMFLERSPHQSPRRNGKS